MYKSFAFFNFSIYFITREARIYNILHVIRLILKLKKKIRIIKHINIKHC